MFDLDPHKTPDSDGEPGLRDQSFQQQARLLVAGRLLSPEGSETFKRIVAHDMPVSLTPMRLLFELHREISELGKQANYPGSIDRLLNSLALSSAGALARLMQFVEQKRLVDRDSDNGCSDRLHQLWLSVAKGIQGTCDDALKVVAQIDAHPDQNLSYDCREQLAGIKEAIECLRESGLSGYSPGNPSNVFDIGAHLVALYRSRCLSGAQCITNLSPSIALGIIAAAGWQIGEMQTAVIHRYMGSTTLKDLCMQLREPEFAIDTRIGPVINALIDGSTRFALGVAAGGLVEVNLEYPTALHELWKEAVLDLQVRHAPIAKLLQELGGELVSTALVEDRDAVQVLLKLPCSQSAQESFADIESGWDESMERDDDGADDEGQQPSRGISIRANTTAGKPIMIQVRGQEFLSERTRSEFATLLEFVDELAQYLPIQGLLIGEQDGDDPSEGAGAVIITLDGPPDASERAVFGCRSALLDVNVRQEIVRLCQLTKVRELHLPWDYTCSPTIEARTILSALIEVARSASEISDGEELHLSLDIDEEALFCKISTSDNIPLVNGWYRRQAGGFACCRHRVGQTLEILSRFNQALGIPDELEDGPISWSRRILIEIVNRQQPLQLQDPYFGQRLVMHLSSVGLKIDTTLLKNLLDLAAHAQEHGSLEEFLGGVGELFFSHQPVVTSRDSDGVIHIRAVAIDELPMVPQQQ